MPLNTAAELDAYCRRTLTRSHRQFGRDGSLVEQARRALDEPSIWTLPWAPAECDFGAAAEHPTWHEHFDDAQRLAWTHLAWALDYFTVSQGEGQLIRMNVHAARAMGDQLPAVVELERRESEEERDHIACFRLVVGAVWRRYLPGLGRPPVPPTSGLSSGVFGERAQDVMGPVARRLLGQDFPPLFFLARGIKSHGFKPFEVAMSRFEESPAAIRRISAMHGQDESRHIASAHHLARLGRSLSRRTSTQSQWLFELALRALFPSGRLDGSRYVYWRYVLDRAPIFASVPPAARDALFEHVRARHGDRMGGASDRYSMIRKSNGNLIDGADLPAGRRAAFLEHMRSDPMYARLVAAASETGLA